MENTVTISTKEYLELIKLKENNPNHELINTNNLLIQFYKSSTLHDMIRNNEYQNEIYKLNQRIEALEAENERLKSMSIWDFLFKKNI